MKTTDLFNDMQLKECPRWWVWSLGYFNRKFLKGFMSQYRICYNEACSLQKNIDLVKY